MSINHQTGFAELNGTKFYYEMAGTGQPLVLVHAGICDSRMWDDQFYVFTQHYRVVRYDQRGYGQTAPVDGVYTRHTDLLALLDYLEIKRAHLLGCSMGGSTVLDFALAYPDRVGALIPVCCEPDGFQDPVDEPLPPGYAEYEAAAKAGDLAYANAYEVHLWVDGLQRTPEQVDATLRQKVFAMNQGALQYEALQVGERQKLAPPAAARLGEIQAPTLLIIGDLDYPSMLRAADLMATAIADAQKATIQGTAHLPNMEQPAQFNQMVLDFLQTKGSRTMRKQNWIEPATGFDEVIARWVWMLEETRRRTKEALAGISDVVLNWMPPEGGNSIGTVLYHTVAIELDWLFAEILETQDYPPELFSRLLPFDVRDAAGQLTGVHGETLESHLARLDAGRKLFFDKLRTISRADFYRVRHLEPYDVTPEWVLYHLMHHEAEHCGQILELRRRAEKSLMDGQ